MDKIITDGAKARRIYLDEHRVAVTREDMRKAERKFISGLSSAGFSSIQDYYLAVRHNGLQGKFITLVESSPFDVIRNTIAAIVANREIMIHGIHNFPVVFAGEENPIDFEFCRKHGVGICEMKTHAAHLSIADNPTFSFILKHPVDAEAVKTNTIRLISDIVQTEYGLIAKIDSNDIMAGVYNADHKILGTTIRYVNEDWCVISFGMSIIVDASLANKIFLDRSLSGHKEVKEVGSISTLLGTRIDGKEFMGIFIDRVQSEFGCKILGDYTLDLY